MTEQDRPRGEQLMEAYCVCFIFQLRELAGYAPTIEQLRRVKWAYETRLALADPANPMPQSDVDRARQTALEVVRQYVAKHPDLDAVSSLLCQTMPNI